MKFRAGKCGRAISILLLLAAAISGCSILPKEGVSKTFFVLEPGAEPAPQFSAVKPVALLVGTTSAGMFINSNRILFSDNPETRSYYQYSFWTEPPTVQFSRLLIGKLEQSNGFETISRASVGAVGDYQLNTEIKEFYQDRSVSPPLARVVIAANAVTILDRRILASSTFSESVPLEQDNAAGAVRAFTAASGKIENSIVSWIYDAISKGGSAGALPSLSDGSIPQ
jgi:cholesterol transport system auxiliary component